MSSVSITESEAKYQFLPLIQGTEDFQKISKLLHEKPNLLEFIKNSESYNTQVLYKKGKMVGLFSIKNELSSKYSEHGVVRSLELSVFELCNEKKRGSGFRTKLLSKIKETAREKLADNIHVLVPKKKNDWREDYFLRNGFSHQITLDGDVENQLFCKKMCSSPAPTPPEKRETALPVERVSSSREDIQKRNVGEHLGKRLHSEQSQPETESRYEEASPPPWKKSRSRQFEPVLAPPQRNFYGDRQVQRGSQEHSITLKYKYINQILAGEKTVEGRINKGFVHHLKQGDTIRFYCQSNSATCRITKIERFNTFYEMLEKCGYKNCVPDERSLESADRLYHSIPGYTQRAARFGVAAIHIEKLNGR